jgi:hypothetical protein
MLIKHLKGDVKNYDEEAKEDKILIKKIKTKGLPKVGRKL